jgi:hypothetical protein
MKASDRPSGEKRACRSCLAPIVACRGGAEPSAGASQIECR